LDCLGRRCAIAQRAVGLPWQVRHDLLVEPFLRFAARQDRLSDRDIRDPRIDPTGTPGWVTLNVSGRWMISPNAWWMLALENLTDAAYREHGSGVNAPGIGVRTYVEVTF
ncbi:MAG: hypothetical protein O7J95_19515, partial [Planctomycetota bacterium]|nr:hypothetical protein [Planctomycetota bacterium]